jgi:hypothetical protein
MIVALLAGAGLLGGLFGNPHNNIQLITTLAGRTCAQVLDLSAPVALAYSGRQKSQDVVIDGSAPCIQTSAGPALYRVFQLPAADAPYVVTVGSEPSDSALLSPRVLLLDSQGTVKRQFAGDDLRYQGDALSARFRGHGDETYLVIESDPSVIGSTVSRIAESTNTYVAASGAAVFTIHTGNDAHNEFLFSHSGALSISLEPVPDPK